MADPHRPTISTHVLDLGTGRPATGVDVVLTRLSDGEAFGPASTDEDGRIADLLNGSALQPSHYELSADVAAHSHRTGNAEPFLLRVTVVFEVRDTARSYHVPFLLSPFGVSSYRGS